MKNSSSYLSLGFVGDMGLSAAHDQLYQKFGKKFLHEEVECCFEGVDLLVANLESSIADSSVKGKKKSDLFFSPDLLNTVKDNTPICFSLANNHIMDYGEKGIERTIHYLNKFKIPYFGAGMSLVEAIQPYMVEVKNRKIGIIAGSQFDYSNAKPSAPGAAPIHKKRMVRQITEIRKICDYVIVILHADEEFQDFPSPHRVKFSRKLVDSGADAVIQHHPHVVQGIELYKNAVIAYSLGNWAFKISAYQEPHLESRYGLFLKLDLPIRPGVPQKISPIHTRIDGYHRPALVSDEEVVMRQDRLEYISTLDHKLIKEKWFACCFFSLRREFKNTYYILRKSGFRSFILRVRHLFGESLFRKKILGLLSLGNY